MAQWNWLTNLPSTWRFVLRVLLKAAALFVVSNLVFALAVPMPLLGRLSLYNWLAPGRLRLPYGENPKEAYNLSLMNLDAMFASHEVAVPPGADEYRVLFIGDSATWGWMLAPEDTLAAQIDTADHTLTDGRRVRAYNLGYPVMSLTKDLMLLDYAMRCTPDLIVWPVTLQSFPRDGQLSPPLVQHNPARVRPLIESFGLKLDPTSPDFVELDALDQTLVGRRRALADLLRLQLYGFAWAATSIDQADREYTPLSHDMDADATYRGWEPQPLTADLLAFDVLRAGLARAGGVPVLLVNEPIFIAQGKNSDIRYNTPYPRWAYDAYRARLAEVAQSEGVPLLDVWDLIAPPEFTDSAVHLTPAGTIQFAERLRPAIAALAEGEPMP